MLLSRWPLEDCATDDIDPGKDIFALLFLSFFLINAVFLFCISQQAALTARINTAANSGGKLTTASSLAHFEMKGDMVSIIQNGVQFVLPQDLGLFCKKGQFETTVDKNGNRHKALIARDPGNSMTAGQALMVVQMLNNKGINIDFKTISVAK